MSAMVIMGAAGTKKRCALRLPDRVWIEGPAGGLDEAFPEADALGSARVFGEVDDVERRLLLEPGLVAEQLGDELAVLGQARHHGRGAVDVDPGHCFLHVGMAARRDLPPLPANLPEAHLNSGAELRPSAKKEGADPARATRGTGPRWEEETVEDDAF